MKRREYIGLDLTPVIDVVFILLIFFIVTSVFKKDELALMLNLPEADAKAIEIKDEQVFIELNENKIAIKGLEVNFISLEENLKLIKDKKSAIIVKIDKDTKYERITKVLDLLQKYNLNNLALVTSEKNKN
ncbi:biopolymer transporter ExbD [Halarcobacter sp.]|uniref:ExbD/TolR family protein n=1 Tax=Halarcobacter sp. TaxID=2321133 RepID=UPI0029F48ADA|nr:biopolymer transporter ExbD [Halarcobacter sp.]